MTVPLLRLIVPADAPELADVLARNREHLAPWDPDRPEEFWTVEGQATHLEAVVTAYAAGRTVPYAITVNGAIIGPVT